MGIFGDSKQTTENNTAYQGANNLSDQGNLESLNDVSKTTLADAGGDVYSHLHGNTITTIKTADGVVEGASEATLAALDNNTLLAADSTGKLLDSNNNATALAGTAIDDITALAGIQSDNITALAGLSLDNMASLSGQTNDNITALAGLIVENGNNSTDTFAGFATGANDNATALAGVGFDALSTNNEQSLAVLSNVATEALHTANIGMGAIRDTAGMGFTTAQNIATHGLDKLGDNSAIAIAALSNESSESKEALTTVAGWSLATTEKQFDTAITELGMSNRSAQADMVAISGQSADLMSTTLGNVLTNGQVSMQKTSNEGMKVIGWVAGAAVVAIVLLSSWKKG